jgi:uncharacterized caspase-like protein
LDATIEEDLLIFQFSGHGVKSDPTAATPDKLGLQLGAFDGLLHWRELSILRTFPCRVLVILDCSGAGSAVLYEKAIQDQQSVKALHMLAACRSDQLALEERNNGAFTSVLLRALRGEAGQSARDFVELEDVINFLLAHQPKDMEPQFLSLGARKSEPLPLTSRRK